MSAPDDTADQPGATPEDIAWMVVRAQLASDPRGRDILLRLATAPVDAADDLRQYLGGDAAPAGFATIVTGGVVDRIVNIAQAGVVNIAAPKATVAPRQLPPDIADFTDRTAPIDEIINRAVPGVAPAGGAPAIFAIIGGAGVGKSALAVHAAHRLAHTYPDAQLHVNLRARAPLDVLEALLRALGVDPDRIPADEQERAGLYRAALAARRSVVLLDNADDAAQVRPLLPGDAGSVVLITSRDALAGLAGTTRLVLDVLPPEYALELLGRVLGPERLAAEPDAASKLARACDHLPLALRIVAARLVSRPQWTLDRMATRLADESRRLSELEVGDLTMRASFALSHDGLPDDLRRAFRLAALVPGQTFAPWLLAALLDTDVDTATEHVERLTELRLLEYAGTDATGEDRYQFHDLLRLFAREKLAEARADEQAAVERAFGAYLTIARRGLYLLSPHSKRDPDPGLESPWPVPGALVDRLLAEPYAWFTAEHRPLVEVIRQAHQRQMWRHVYELTEQLHYYFRVRSHLADWLRTGELALAAARAVGDRRAEGWVLRHLGNALQDQGRYDEAARCFADGAAVFTALGNTLGRAATVCNLGETRMTQGRFAQASAQLTACLPDWRSVDDPVGAAYTLDNLGYIATCQGDFDAAEEHLDASLAQFRALGDRFGEAHSLRRRGALHVERGAVADAERDLQRSLDLFRDLGSAGGIAWAEIGLARIYLSLDRPDPAVELATGAVRSLQDLGDVRAAAQAMLRLGEALLGAGRDAEAVAVLEQARERLVGLGDEYGGAIATYLLARAHGDADLAGAAAAMFAELPAPLWEQRARALSE